jgi:hypothetical protein
MGITGGPKERVKEGKYVDVFYIHI